MPLAFDETPVSTTPPITLLTDLSFLQVQRNGDVLVEIHVVPNASRTEAVGLHGEAGHEALRVRLHAPPVDGKANLALKQWLADTLGIARRTVTLVRGDTSRRKQLRVSQVGAAQARWALLLVTMRVPPDQGEHPRD